MSVVAWLRRCARRWAYAKTDDDVREGYEDYDPNGVGVANGNFLGLPRVADPAVWLLPVHFAPTVSFGTGTENAPGFILRASYQLDVCVSGLSRPWELGFEWRKPSRAISELHKTCAPLTNELIVEQEAGRPLSQNYLHYYATLVKAGRAVISYVAEHVREAWSVNALPVVIGGDHSVPLGAYQVLPAGAGILHLDAHMDLRAAYEGFRYSHASVMLNALNTSAIGSLVQVGIRDYCPAELSISQQDDRVSTFFAADFHAARLRGEAFAKTIQPVIDALPQQVWLSLDVDVLEIALCPHTGTPVPGGMRYEEVTFLAQAVLASGRRIIGMDIVETGDHPTDANVSARLIYELASRACLAQR